MASSKPDNATRFVVRDGAPFAPRALHIFVADDVKMTREEAKAAADARAFQAKRAGRVGVDVIEWKPAPAGTKATVSL